LQIFFSAELVETVEISFSSDGRMLAFGAEDTGSILGLDIARLPAARIKPCTYYDV
jgi:hypothetical protein